MLRKLGIVSAVVMLTLIVVGVAFATVITVDGVGTDWPGHPDCTIGAIGCSAIVTDAVDVTYAGNPVNPEYDLNHLWLTNDGTNLYLRIDTYPSTISTWATQGSQDPKLGICLDTDNNIATGTTAPTSFCNLGSTMPGVDKYITIVGDGSGNPVSFRYFECGAIWPCTNNAAKASRVSVAYQNAGASTESITELSFPLSDLGLNTGAHVYTMTLAVYFDNGASPTEDSIPDDPPYPIVLVGCDTTDGPCSPTAITLESLQAQPTTSPVVPLALIGVSAVALISVVFVVRRRKIA